MQKKIRKSRVNLLFSSLIMIPDLLVGLSDYVAITNFQIELQALNLIRK